MAWLNITDRTGADPNASADIDQLMEDIRVVAGNGVAAPPDDCTGLDARVTVLEGTTITAKEHYTRMHGGQHFDILYKDADEIVIKCKHAQGLGAWIGVVLNDNTYLELTSDFTVKYDTPANSGHILDGITAKLNNEWFVLWAYKNSSNALAFGLTWMFNATFSNANPTTSLTLNTVNSQNVGLLCPANAHLVLWKDTDELETPLGYNDAGTFTYDATRDAPKVSSRTTTALTLGASLSNTTFTASSKVYQVDGFKPLDVTSGDIVSTISTRGYRDTGLRIMTDGSGGVMNFILADGEFRFIPATDGNITSVAVTAAWANYLITHCPPDKTSLLLAVDYSATVSYIRRYYHGAGFAHSYNSTMINRVPILHRILSIKFAASNISPYGYII